VVFRRGEEGRGTGERERGKWLEHERGGRQGGGEYKERSAMVIMKAPTKLETPPFLISSRPMYVGCIRA